jgi:tRNA threonylcarbamoyladenosine biosynthesis protein TsaB
MLTLGIETSGFQGSVALTRDGDCLADRTLEKAGRRHAQTLVSEIDRLLKDFGHTANDLNLIAVSLGPGSFTGLRVGIVCAKTLAYATGCQLAAIDTFLAIAENSPEHVTEISIVSDAQRQELFVGQYQRDEQNYWQQEQEITVVPGESWLNSLDGPAFVSGTGLKPFESSEFLCQFLPEECRQPQAAAIAKLGERKQTNGCADEIWSLEPFYLRKSAAEEKWDQRQS